MVGPRRARPLRSPLTRTASGDLHGFTPADNQADVDVRAAWPITAVVDELFAGYEAAASAIDRAADRLDGVGLGEWIHGGDVREPLGASDPYTSAGADSPGSSSSSARSSEVHPGSPSSSRETASSSGRGGAREPSRPISRPSSVSSRGGKPIQGTTSVATNASTSSCGRGGISIAIGRRPRRRRRIVHSPTRPSRDCGRVVLSPHIWEAVTPR
jgi:hypothetical protein